MLDLVKEAVAYAKLNKGYHRILLGIKDRYQSMGKFSGYVSLRHINEEESQILGSIDYRFFGLKEAKLSVKSFIECFCQGRFENLDFELFMKEYFKDELLSNKEVKTLAEEKQWEYFNRIMADAQDSPRGAKWLLSALDEKTYGYNSIIKEYKADSKALKKKLHYVMKALETIEYSREKVEPLPLFSSGITKDPHYFDIGTTAFRLLVFGICYELDESYPQGIEGINELLYSGGITRDEVSIFTTIYGIKALKGAEIHKGWQGFCKEGEPLHISIKNLNSIDQLAFDENNIYIFENPVVFMEVISRTRNINPDKRPALICTSGQLNTASLILLDKLYKQGAKLYYSGDFDPEGIRIADKLKTRYGDNLILWRYSREDYLMIKGSKTFESREQKLSNIKNHELREIKGALEEYKVCGYQELMIDQYVQDIQRMSDIQRM